MKTLLLLLFVGLPLLAQSQKSTIKHRFYMLSESDDHLHYIDEFNPTKSWKFPPSGKGWDMQLLDINTMLFPTKTGWETYDLRTHKQLSIFKHEKLTNVMSVQSLADGTKFVVANQKGITVFKFSANNKLLAVKNFSNDSTVRAIRLNPGGTATFAHADGFTEVSQENLALIKQLPLPAGKKAFMASRAENGHYYLGGGYGGAFFELDAEGSVLKAFKMENLPGKLENKFYAGYEIQKNGNIVTTHWTGHGKRSSRKGYQVLEFNPAGQLIWFWHQPHIAGTAVQVIIVE